MNRSVNDMSTIRIANTQLLLRTLYNLKEISRSDLTRITKLSSSAVTSITKKLMEKNLIIEKECAVEKVVGRPKNPITINNKLWYVLGLHISDEKSANLVLFNLYGKQIDNISLFFEKLDLKTVTRSIVQGVKVIKERLNNNNDIIIGLGIGFSGIINNKNGNCIYSESIKWNEAPIGALLNKELDIPVIIECDVNASALAEYINFKNNNKISSLAVLMIGNGIGLGLIINGNIYNGHMGGAGEISHILNFNYDSYKGKGICHCGQKSCISNFITKKGVIDQIKKLSPEEKINEDEPLIWICGDKNSKDYSQILYRVANSTGTLLKLITETYDPATIIISSSYKFDQQTKKDIDSIYGKRLTLPQKFKKEVVFKKYSNITWAWGAAYTVIHKFLNDIKFWPTIFDNN